MTQSEFLKYILDNDCYVYQQKPTYYKIRKKGTTGTSNMSGLPISDPDTILFAPMMCQICRSLGVKEPDECIPAKNLIETIWQWILTHLIRNS